MKINCGHLFCAECSKYLTPVPEKCLFTPQRVCHDCYLSLTTPNLIIETVEDTSPASSPLPLFHNSKVVAYPTMSSPTSEDPMSTYNDTTTLTKAALTEVFGLGPG
ncbi:unnamed protein product [Protopolystoma xenopodis]|uniref:FYVE zinc finger domain-containing protein n=1 Tax=Protopolystoma xenopodis TaxID=117903 RepID=A0A448WQN5_9PLAT|nr:unnamed protein product [Protopolystoma xenopodis]